MFGHGMTFKTVKWPPFWYRADALLDALGRYPALWQGPAADPGDRRALAELAACLIRYNTTTQGRVIPHSAYRGFETSRSDRRSTPPPTPPPGCWPSCTDSTTSRPAHSPSTSPP